MVGCVTIKEDVEGYFFAWWLHRTGHPQREENALADRRKALEINFFVHIVDARGHRGDEPDVGLAPYERC